jgi:dTDP-4-dehydrorhamnose 3,5-epimerase
VVGVFMAAQIRFGNEVSQTYLALSLALPLLWIGALKQFFRASSYGAGGVGAGGWRQVNLTWTQRGALRGLHGEATDKLVGVACGEAFGVYLDARRGSPTFGLVVTERLTPGVPGVAINALDRELRIAWPIAPEPGNPAMVSAKDASAPRFADL